MILHPAEGDESTNPEWRTLDLQPQPLLCATALVGQTILAVLNSEMWWLEKHSIVKFHKYQEEAGR